jgi:uncharacterized oligopeptide transporter (OPT) family protein
MGFFWIWWISSSYMTSLYSMTSSCNMIFFVIFYAIFFFHFVLSAFCGLLNSMILSFSSPISKIRYPIISMASRILIDFSMNLKEESLATWTKCYIFEVEFTLCMQQLLLNDFFLPQLGMIHIQHTLFSKAHYIQFV